MQITNLLMLFETADSAVINDFAIANELHDYTVYRRNNAGEEVESGEIMTIYKWQSLKKNTHNPINFIAFNKWTDGVSNLLDIQLRDEDLFNEFLNQARSIPAFQKLRPGKLKQNNTLILKFNYLPANINLMFISSQDDGFLSDNHPVFGIVLMYDLNKMTELSKQG